MELFEPATPVEWSIQLKSLISRERRFEDEPDRRELTEVENRQSSVSGGALLKFLRFLTDRQRQQSVPALQAAAQKSKVLLCIMDKPGAIAAHDILRMFHPTGIWVLRSEWDRMQNHAQIADPALEWHCEYTSCWQRNPIFTENGDPASGNQLWAHEEVFRIEPAWGAGARHLWRWTGSDLVLQQEAAEQWKI